MPSGKVSLVNCVPLKAESPIFVNVLGNTTSFKLELIKAEEPISVMPSGKVSLVNCVSLKAATPIFVNVLGNTTSFKLEPEKAEEPISVTVSGIFMLEIPEP